MKYLGKVVLSIMIWVLEVTFCDYGSNQYVNQLVGYILSD